MKHNNNKKNFVTLLILALIIFISTSCSSQQKEKKESSQQHESDYKHDFNYSKFLHFKIPENYEKSKRHGYFMPQVDLKDLFFELTKANICEDSKELADSTPKDSPENIYKKYLNEKEKNGFDLKKFFFNHFDLPKNNSKTYKTTSDITIENHIDSLWNFLKRPKIEAVDKLKTTLLNLPYTYVVPGGRFREMYYWDTYFTILGLLSSGQKDSAIDMLRAFDTTLKKIGYIPNGYRSYYFGRSQPPFFALMIEAIFKNDYDQMDAFIEGLVIENNYWMKSDIVNEPKTFEANQKVVQIESAKVNRFFSDIKAPRTEGYKEDIQLFLAKYPNQTNITDKELDLFVQIRSACESGWDFSTRWLSNAKDRASFEITHLIPTDLNSILYQQENLLYRYFKNKGNEKKASKYLEQSNKRRKTILEYNWNKNLEFFTDYNFVKAESKEHLNLSATFPLFVQIATKRQAEKVAYRIKNDFLKDGGLITTLINSGEQWDAPHGWAPLHYIAIKGLLNYGYIDLAKNISQRWLKLIEVNFKKSGKIMEKYNVVDLNSREGGGEYPNQEGFGWTNGVYLQLLKEELLLKQ